MQELRGALAVGQKGSKLATGGARRRLTGLKPRMFSAKPRIFTVHHVCIKPRS